MQQVDPGFGSEDASKVPCGNRPLIPESCFLMLGFRMTKGTTRYRASCCKHSTICAGLKGTPSTLFRDFQRF